MDPSDIPTKYQPEMPEIRCPRCGGAIEDSGLGLMQEGHGALYFVVHDDPTCMAVLGAMFDGGHPAAQLIRRA